MKSAALLIVVCLLALFGFAGPSLAQDCHNGVCPIATKPLPIVNAKPMPKANGPVVVFAALPRHPLHELAHRLHEKAQAAKSKASAVRYRVAVRVRCR